MGDHQLVAQVAVFVAALVQAATGLGFGLLAVPVLMLALDDVAAVQASIVLNLMIALILAPPLARRADRRMLGRLLIGAVAGLPIGIVIYVAIDLGTLELLAGAVVLTMGVSVLAVARSAVRAKPRRGARLVDIAVGALSGIMTACLAMPGPAPGGWMAARAFGKTAIRSTMLTFFVPAYALALVLQVSVARVAVDTWATTATLAPATLVGLLSGNALASRIGERVFRLWIAFLLSSTAVVLSIDAFSRASS